MANPQHVEWLLEGKDAWNTRRENDDFTPDLSEIILDELLEGANLSEVNMLLGRKTPSLDGYNLISANFRGCISETTNFSNCKCNGADFRDARIHGSFFGWAFLKNANFSNTTHVGLDFQGATLSAADFSKCTLKNISFMSAGIRGANFTQVTLMNPDFSNADARNLGLGWNGEDKLSSTRFGPATNFSDAKELTEEHLDSMTGIRGLNGTILPKGLAAPDHWELLAEEVDPESDAYIRKKPAARQLNQPKRIPQTTTHQVTHILQTANAAKNSAAMATIQTDTLIQSYIAQNGRPNDAPEIDFLEALKTTFQHLETALNKNTTDAARIQELEALLEASREEITNLTKLLANKPSTFHAILVGATGGALGTAIVAATAALYGIAAPELINAINDLLTAPQTPPQPHITTEV